MLRLGSFKSGAVFSEDKQYRYRLWRCWDPHLPRALFICLNPSTADDIHNDPTIERQQRRVVRWRQANLGGPADTERRALRLFGSIEVVNAFAWRSVSPKSLYGNVHVPKQHFDPIGADNDLQIVDAAAQTVANGGIVICGWGQHAAKLPSGHPAFASRHGFLLQLMHDNGIEVSALALNDDGTPKHPLYVGYDLNPRRWHDGRLHEEVI